MKLRARLWLGVMAVFFGLCAPVLAYPALQPAPAEITDGWEMSWIAGVVMLVLLFGAFFAMTKYEVPLPLGRRS